MALGFGFNKAKSLAAAEKFVQQGKLPNAISEYEKIAKQDPKDLTVLNTIGDLYARLGRADQASEAFKKVGDAYAADGFVVKAIAMYKKLTKLNPSALDSVVRLAELYTQQGLYNDARAQYTTVADQYLKHNDRENATGILKKMLDLDPENAAMQTKVADLYLKLGKNKEALDIYYNSAQALYQRGAIANADEALERVLHLDQKFGPALQLRGQIAIETGNGPRAIECLSKLPDLDSKPEALRPLLQAYVQSGDLDKANPIAAKLVDIHNDLSAIPLYADALFAAGEPEQALQVYARNADKLLAQSKQALAEPLTACVSKARESAPALQILLPLLEKAGVAGAALREVQELLAHAFVLAGELQKAADLYQELAKAEPENPLHEQNYRQVISRMGKDSVTRELSVEEGGQALMVDELEAPPVVVQEYSRDITEAINSALTDSELFSSYNVPEKAIPPLEHVLPRAPQDVRLRQRLASLYARVGRLADAAECCSVLAEVHASGGFAEQALQFREMAGRYSQQAGIPLPVPESGKEKPAVDLVPGVSAGENIEPFQASSVQEFPVEPPVHQEPSIAELDLSSVKAESLVDAAETVPAIPESESGTEWEEMLTVEQPAAEPEAGSSVQEITAEETPDEILEECRFYLSQGMSGEARSAVARLERVAPDHPALEELRSSVAASEAAAPAVSEAKPAAEEAAEVSPAAEIDIQPAAPAIEPESVPAAEVDIASTPAAAQHGGGETKPAARDADVLEEVAADASDEVSFDELMPEVGAGEPASFTAPPSRLPSVPPAVAAPAGSTSADPLAGIVSDLEDVLSDLGPPPTATPAARPAAVAAAVAKPQPAAAQVAVQTDPAEAQSMLSDLLDEFKEGIEEPAEDSDDPDTHYNLGVAFREMGLLDEAIGELQKVCRALDTGKPFSQPIQAYTWLAQCLVDKGAAPAAIRWYERALQVKGISEDSRLAVYYDMAHAFESAGNKKAALDNFMQVYGSNIDYRDVADRIRSLQK